MKTLLLFLFSNIFQLITKLHTTRFIIIVGFLISLSNHSLRLLNFYQDESSSILLALEDTEEKSDTEEKENSEEKDDIKEKEMIFHNSEEKSLEMWKLYSKRFPEIYLSNFPIYPEYTTPPPENSYFFPQFFI
ncbi:hypothetical protein ACE939_12765 [Aquimarina sp. W85]|uniref:hypothetical protein n=1 Tax=Aquimarina rhodophyticola TaxID=3342246 RepID=UPI00366B78C7